MPSSDPSSIWTRNFVAVSTANLLMLMSLFTLIPTLPVYVLEKGGDNFTAGMIIGLFTVAALLARPFAGRAVDTLGRRRVLLLGLGVIVAAVSGYHWTTTVLLILVVRMVQGVGFALASTSLGTIVADIVPPARRGEGIGYFGMTGNLAMAVGPLVGLTLLNAYGFGALFVVALLLVLLSLLISRAITCPEVIHLPEHKATAFLGLVDKETLLPAALLVLLAVPFGGLISFITLFSREVGIENAGLFFLGHAGAVMLVRPLAGRLFDRKGPAWVLLPGILLSILGLLILANATGDGALLLASVCYGLGFGATQPSMQAWIINRVSPGRRGSATGTFFLAVDIGISMGSVLMGKVAAVSSYAGMYRWSIGFPVVFLAVYILYLWRSERGRGIDR